ncbi:SDR family oxidoreductase [Nitrosopumilus piranensis]|uniref:Dehydrogenase n=1 Tax=Nitrosopumilus piranensis TaxID=1582439 RepID=A0A0C5BT00_9ARCH|nr:SDR family oxidoreductase [Nitrosopumilus piranensis]AJM91264.1 Dehydrogenase [Nitrosopumilus piranensis]
MNVKKLFDLSNKVVVITGGAGLLGSQYAEGLTQAGANVIIADTNFEACKKIAKKLDQIYDKNSMPIKLDITNKKSIDGMVNKILKKYSKIDVLINNAAIQGNPKLRTTSFEEFPESEWGKALDVNLTGMFLCCQKIGKVMVKQKKGVIINVSSTYGIVAPDQRIYGKSGQNAAAFYSATKSGVLNFTRYLASYWNGKGIRVNTLSPGGVEKGQEKEFVKKYSAKTMLGRMARKDEYVGAIIFLASDASSYMTGSNLIVDGGWTAW